MISFKKVRLIDEIDFEQCAQKLAPCIPDFSEGQVLEAFQDYVFHDRDEIDHWLAPEHIREAIQSLMTEFLAEHAGETKFSAKTALDLKMELNCSEAFRPGQVLPSPHR